MPDTPGQVRRATPADLDTVLALLREMHKEAPFGAWSEQRVRETIAEVGTTGVILLSLANGRPVGTAGLQPQQPWWSEAWQLAERWLFVHPEHRRTGPHSTRSNGDPCAACPRAARGDAPRGPHARPAADRRRVLDAPHRRQGAAL